MKRLVKLFIGIVLAVILSLSLIACSPKEKESTKAGSSSVTQTYQGFAQAYNGEINVLLELDKDKNILDVKVGKNKETQNIGTIPIEKIPKSVVDSQSLDVDNISGATITSDAIIVAIAYALEKANLNPDDYGYIGPTINNSSVEIDYEIDKSTMPLKKEITGQVTIKDAKDREVELDLPISSYAISTMDVIDYIIPLKGEDAFSMLVGSGQDGGHGFNKYAELYVPEVGNYMKHTGQISNHNSPFDLEVILAMEPDVIIINSAMGAHKYALEIEDILAEAGIKIVLIDVPGKKLENSVQDTMGILGKIFQEEEKAAEVSKFIGEQYEIIKEKNLAIKEEKPSVYYEKSGYSNIFGPTSTSERGWG